MEQKLLEICEQFVQDNRISSAESIYQCDCVSENALNFIEQIVEIVGYYKHNENEE